MENTSQNWRNCVMPTAKGDNTTVTNSVNKKTCSGSVVFSCRLCLKEQDELRVDIFAKSEINDKTNSLADHLFDLLQVKYENYPPLPQGICDNCIFMVEAFTNFRDNVKTREAELLYRYKELRTKYMHSTMDYNEQEIALEPDESYEIIDVNVEQDYESSDDDFSLESENETESNEITARAPEQDTKNDDFGMHSSLSDANSIVTQQTEIVTNRTLCYLCQYCDMAFTTQPACFEHETKFHDSSLPFCCNYCQLRVNKRQTLISHIKHQHQADRPYICSLCGKSFCRRSDLKKHTIVHTGVRPYTCGLCAKNFSRNTNLTKHMRIHNSLRPHVCQLCPRSFSTVQELDVHTRSHNDNKAYQCEQCPASYSRRDKLHKHKLSHLRWQKERQILQAQPTDVQLEAHLPVPEHATTYSTYHDQSSFVANVFQQQPMGSAKPRSFNCNFCAKSFTRQQDYQRHQGLHLDDLFMCKICNEGFSRQEKLIRHMNEYHKPEFKCNICNISFAQTNALELHMKIQHLQRDAAGGNHQLSEHEAQATTSSELPKQETNVSQTPSFDELSYNSKIIPTMNLGFYSETPSAS